jgi:hypothetical protein
MARPVIRAVDDPRYCARSGGNSAQIQYWTSSGASSLLTAGRGSLRGSLLKNNTSRKGRFS